MKRKMNSEEATPHPSSFSPFEEKYLSKVDYPYLLFIQIQRVLDAIDAGGSGMEELKNLKAILKPSWRDEIEEKKGMKEKEKKLKNDLEDIAKEKGVLGIRTYREKRRMKMVEYVREYVQKVIEKLDEVGLLLVEERTIMRGGGML